MLLLQGRLNAEEAVTLLDGADVVDEEEDFKAANKVHLPMYTNTNCSLISLPWSAAKLNPFLATCDRKIKANISSPAFRDRDAGSTSNRGKPTDDGNREDRQSNQSRGGRGQGNYEGRGGRGGRGGRSGRGGGRAGGNVRDDRHTRGYQKYLLPLSFFRLESLANSDIQRP